jgi:hypothetical protein
MHRRIECLCELTSTAHGGYSGSRKRKNRPARRFFRRCRELVLLSPGNRVWHDRATEYPTSLAALGPINQAPSADSVAVAYTLAL